MRGNNRSIIGFILVALMIVGVTAQGGESQYNNSISMCSSQLSLLQKQQLNRLQAENTEQLSTYLINGNIVQKLLDNDINFINQIIINIKQFLIRTLKPSIYLSIFILSFVFISQRSQYLAKLSFLQQNRGIIDSITSKIRKLTPYLLGVCAIIIIFSAIRAIIIVKDQPKHFSEVSCLLGNGPKLRLYEDGKQKLLKLNEIIQLLSSQQVYFKEDLLQLALFVDYRLYLTQNLNLANMIKKSSNIKKAQKSYLSQIQSFIATLQQMVTIQTMEQSTHLKRHFHTYVSTYVQEAKLFLGLNKMLDGNFMYPLIYDFQIILFSACFIISIMLAFFAYKKITNYNQQNRLTRLLRSFIVYLIVVIFILFAVLSLIIIAMFWVNNGVIKPILKNEFLDKLKQIHMAVDFTEKYLPNSGATREIRRQQLLKKAEFYYNMFNPLAQKENDYCYNLFKKSLPFLNVQQKKQVMAKLDIKYINSSQLITQTKIAQDTFRRIIISLNKTSTLNRIQYSDYGDYVCKILFQLRKAIFTNFYSLRSEAGTLCGALIIFYTLSFISGEKNGDVKTHIRIKSQDVENEQILEEQL